MTGGALMLQDEANGITAIGCVTICAVQPRLLPHSEVARSADDAPRYSRVPRSTFGGASGDSSSTSIGPP
jgi:hypothetical protein